jgi:hypothetical protein
MIPPQIKLIIGAVVFAAIFYGGWNSRSWYEASIREAALLAQQAALNAAMNRESKIAALVEDKLSTLKANQTIIDRGVVREIIKPEYRDICFSDDALRLLSAAAKGEALDLSTELVGEVPRVSE